MTNLEFLQKAYKDALRDERRLTKAETAYWSNLWQIIARSAIVELEKAQRTWVGLNDKQMRKICGSVVAMREAVREAEAILKEGNT